MIGCKIALSRVLAGVSDTVVLADELAPVMDPMLKVSEPQVKYKPLLTLVSPVTV